MARDRGTRVGILTMRYTRAAAPVALALAAWAGEARAIETDQYYAWGRDVADSTDAVNAKFNLELSRVLARINADDAGAHAECGDVRKSIVAHFRLMIFHELELWVANTPLVDRVPSGAEDAHEFRQRYVHHEHGALEFVNMMPPSPTIRLAGVLVGTDKLTHFLSQGSWTYRSYRNAVEKGQTRDEAERSAIDLGILTERSILGLAASGVLSLADLEANYQGMRFLRSLCDDEPPMLEREESGWRMRRPFDFRDWVTPEWDESYQPSVFAKRRWKHVQHTLERYCDALGSPGVLTQREAYATRDGTTVVERRVRELVAAGKLADPESFSIERVCGSTIGARAQNGPGPPQSQSAAHPDPVRGTPQR